jgi:hypothetical protein
MGDGYRAVTVASIGTLTLSGSWRWHRPSQAVPISKDGQWRVCLALQRQGLGLELGAVDANQPATNLQGQLSWVRPPIPTSRYYPSGFTNAVLAEGSRITAPTNRTSA